MINLQAWLDLKLLSGNMRLYCLFGIHREAFLAVRNHSTAVESHTYRSLSPYKYRFILTLKRRTTLCHFTAWLQINFFQHVAHMWPTVYGKQRWPFGCVYFGADSLRQLFGLVYMAAKLWLLVSVGRFTKQLCKALRLIHTPLTNQFNTSLLTIYSMHFVMINISYDQLIWMHTVHVASS